MSINDTTKLVINLPERADRLEQFKKEIKFFDNKDYHLIEGKKFKPSHKAIGEAHIKAITYAEDNLLDCVIIMEDDVKFVGDISYLQEALNNLPEQWDLLLGGLYYSKEKQIPVNDYWNKIGDFCGLHFYIINKNTYDKFKNYNYKEHIDRWAGKNLNCFVINKHIAEQS